MAEWKCDLVEQASDFIVFGDWDYAEGGGDTVFLIVRRNDGSVFGVDGGRDVPFSLLNTSLQSFINTFCLLDEYFAHSQPIPADLDSSARDLDPTAYPESRWHIWWIWR
jgi:hypothetical protein